MGYYYEICSSFEKKQKINMLHAGFLFLFYFQIISKNKTQTKQ
jgi:hypothetical protein